MRVLDLFSGIGGFSLGLEASGMTTAAFCEYEEFPRKVLAKHWPDVPCYPDVRELTKDILDADGIEADIITAGVPCQPASHAGKQRGAEDDRWLWPEALRIVQEVHPRWVIFENVYGFITLNEGMEFDNVLSQLEALGYEVQSFVIPACAVDAKHRRDRVWIIANATGQGLSKRGRSSRHTGNTETRTGLESGAERCGDVADTTGSRQQGQGQSIHASNQAPGSEGQAVDVVDVGERGVWPTEPAVGRVAHGIPARVDRLKSLGNAVVPQVVEQIGRAIMAAEEQLAT